MLDIVKNEANGTVLYVGRMPNRLNKEVGWHFRSDKGAWLGPYPTEDEASVAGAMALEPDC